MWKHLHSLWAFWCSHKHLLRATRVMYDTYADARFECIWWDYQWSHHILFIQFSLTISNANVVACTSRMYMHRSYQENLYACSHLSTFQDAVQVDIPACILVTRLPVTKSAYCRILILSYMNIKSLPAFLYHLLTLFPSTDSDKYQYQCSSFPWSHSKICVASIFSQPWSLLSEYRLSCWININIVNYAKSRLLVFSNSDKRLLLCISGLR